MLAIYVAAPEKRTERYGVGRTEVSWRFAAYQDVYIKTTHHEI